MLTVAGLTFNAPWALALLAALPAIIWLLRAVPPAPRKVQFPAMMILRAIVSRDDTAARTPWWLILLRTVVAAAVILAVARPVVNQTPTAAGPGSLVVLVDNGWAAGNAWDQRRTILEALSSTAEREGRQVALVPTAAPLSPRFMAPQEALIAARALTPKPWPTDMAAVLSGLETLPAGEGQAIWLTDGHENGRSADILAALARLGSVRVLAPEANRPAAILENPVNDAAGLVTPVRLPNAAPDRPLFVRALDVEGRVVARAPVLPQAEGAPAARLTLPSEQRKRIAWLDVEGDTTAAAVALLDSRWRRRATGLAVVAGAPDERPLLDALYYLRRALSPGFDLRRGTIAELLARDLGMMLLTDSVPLEGQDRRRLTDWVTAGGVLVRFAGPRLEAHPGDPLVPVPLTGTARQLGGGMSWTEPQGIGSFAAESPFNDISVPKDVQVARQMLARPSQEQESRTWARLTDGTPLVTAEARGDGWVVLFHVTAGPEWSTLPLSGVFVEMLQRLTELGPGGDGVAETAVPLTPLRSLDGQGRLGAPPRAARAIPAGGLVNAKVGPDLPPGYYGDGENRRALNLGPSLPEVTLLPASIPVETFTPQREFRLAPWLLAAALILFAVDGLAILMIRGFATRRGAIVALALMLPLVAHTESVARADPVDATRETRFAFVRTGDSVIDETTQAGLAGLALILQRRSAVELGLPQGVDPARDELAFYPLLYWPVTQTTPPLSPTAIERINRFMAGGGMLVIDTMGTGMSLRAAAEGLDIPALRPMPEDHVLTRSFYLANQFPGRFDGGTVWVARSESRTLDGVSPVVIGDANWVGAWALDSLNQPLYPVVPGGETQREFAWRFGVNLTMYVLTGNYKGDQVHLPAIMERLTQ